MTHAIYKPRMPVGEGRGNTNDRPLSEIWWIVVHTSEGSEGDSSAEGLASFIGTPASGGNVASYHDITDTDGIIPLVFHDKRCHGASGGNQNGIHICIPGTARQSSDQWLDSTTSKYIWRLAEYIADYATAYSIPVLKLGPSDLKAGRKGICGHVDVANAFHLTDHWDPGEAFPWQIVIDRVAEIMGAQPPKPPTTPDPDVPNNPVPTESDTMLRAAKNKDSGNAYYIGDGNKSTWVDANADPKEAKLLVAGGVIDVSTTKVVYSWDNVTPISKGNVKKYVGTNTKLG